MDRSWSREGVTNWWAVLAIGAGVGFLGGLFGKGGSALATPLLHAIGIPAFVAVAAPLPAAIPSTLMASVPYWKRRMVDRSVLRWSIAFGVPATIVGAVLSRYVGGNALVRLTDVMLVGIGIRSLVHPGGVETADVTALANRRLRLALAATVVGLASGLLANSGGFLLVPVYLAVLHLPIKSAFASSLLVSAALAVPGTIVHVALGHVDWRVVLVFGLASVPLANVGARVALATGAAKLERIYGGGLVTFGAVLLLFTH